MAHIVDNRTSQYSTTSGTTAFSMSGGAVDTGFRSFTTSPNLSNADTFPYTAIDYATGEWEVGIGTWASATQIITRTTVLDNHLGTTATVNFTNPPNVTIALSADEFLNPKSDIDFDGTITATTINTVDLNADNITSLGKLTTEYQVWEKAHVREYEVSYAIDSYLTTGEYLEIGTLTPSASSQQYVLAGKIYPQTAASVHVIDFVLAVRANTLPNISSTLRYNAHNVGDLSLLVEPVFWYDSANGVVKLAIKLVSGTDSVYNVTTSLKYVARGEYSESVFVMTPQGSAEITTGVPTGFVETVGTQDLYLDDYTDSLYWRSNTVWHAGNDGTGSGLDADLLDGQDGSYYAAAADYLPLTGGTVSGGVTFQAYTGFSGWIYIGSGLTVGSVDSTPWNNTTEEGAYVGVGVIQAARDSAAPASFNRMTNNGMVVALYTQGTYRGGLSVKSDNNPDLINGSGISRLRPLSAWFHIRSTAGATGANRTQTTMDWDASATYGDTGYTYSAANDDVTIGSTLDGRRAVIDVQLQMVNPGTNRLILEMYLQVDTGAGFTTIATAGAYLSRGAAYGEDGSAVLCAFPVTLATDDVYRVQYYAWGDASPHNATFKTTGCWWSIRTDD